jgi:hypothetical protein
MKGRIISGVTPQGKMVAVNNRFGNTNIKGQQGTTRVLYDAIQCNGQTEYRFFENAGSKSYPLTNVGAEGNRLNVGDTFVIQKIYFGFIQTDPDTGEVTDFLPGLQAFGADFLKGEFSFQIANSQVIKQLPAIAFNGSEFNPTSVNGSDVALETFTDIVVPPLLEYVATLRTFQGLTQLNVSLACFLEGSAGIIAPQTTF